MSMMLLFVSYQLYDPEKGVVLKRSGFCFIRSIAVADGMLRSDIFTSRCVLLFQKSSSYVESEIFCITFCEVTCSFMVSMLWFFITI